MTAPRLRLSGIEKRFGRTIALSGVSFEVAAGQAIGLIGENGAGKSTLMKVLAGIVTPDGGTIDIDGQPLFTPSTRSPRHALDAGIALVHQELSLHDNLTIAENLFLGREPVRRIAGWGWLDRREMRRRAGELLRRVGLSASPDTLVGTLPIAGKQLLEIARGLSASARVLILDEPTSSLSDDEAMRLFELVRLLQTEGVAVIYISHRLGEITRLADRVEVLRDGIHVATLSGNDIHPDAMVRAMVGRDLNSRSRNKSTADRPVVLRVDDLRVGAATAPAVSFHVAAGEVVALVGLVGAGRTEILETIFGIRRSFGGRVRIAAQTPEGDQVRGGERVLRRGVTDAIAAGVALVPEDRKAAGLLIQSSVRDNCTITAMAHARAWPRIDRHWQTETTRRLIDQLRIKTPSPDVGVDALSGGNQQKVALAKWLPQNGRVLLLDEPTRGVDIGAKAEIYALIDQLSRTGGPDAGGMAILVVSSELEEVFAIADRVLVLAAGRITGEIPRSDLTEEAIMRLAVAGIE